MQTPILAHGLDPRDGPCVMDPHQAGRIRSVLGRPEARRAALSANGNSGGDGKEFDHRGELSVGTAIYLDTDPLFSRSLLDAWQRAGCPVLDNEHPALTLTTLPPTGTGEPAAIRRSVHRRSLGLVSRSETLWCLFRAGRATHHMDFDQGHIHLISRDRVLLGDYGYHSMDSEGRPLATPATYLHNTIVYGDDRHATSGYTGLEQAPEPALVHLGDTFDWCVHRILNTNARRLNQHPYNFLSPAPVTLHIRHYLFVKTGWVLLWDVFEESSLPNTFWLHPTAPLREIGAGEFLSEHPDGCGLFVKFLQPMPVQVIENRPLGPLHSFAVRNEPGLPFLSLLLPCASKERPTVKWNPDAGEVTVAGGMFQDRIILPPPDSTTLPKVTGMFPPALQDVTHLQKKG